MKKNKKNKGNYYLSEKNFPKENLQQKVYANTPEKAAKKLYKMFKKLYFEKGYIKIFSSFNDEWIFNINWINKKNNKFVNNKKSWKKEYLNKIKF